MRFKDKIHSVLAHEICLNCGSMGFKVKSKETHITGESDILGKYGWEAILAECRKCGFTIEKRRFVSQ